MKRSIIAILLAAALLTMFAACGGGPAKVEPTPGEGTSLSVTVVVTLPDGTQNTHELTTTKSTLGEALDDEGLIERDDKNMIIAVDGVEASWVADQAYWAFYIGEDFAMHGVDEEVMQNGNIYEFRYTKG